MSIVQLSGTKNLNTIRELTTHTEQVFAGARVQPALPESDAGLGPGVFWNNGGVVNVTPGQPVSPDPDAIVSVGTLYITTLRGPFGPIAVTSALVSDAVVTVAVPRLSFAIIVPLGVSQGTAASTTAQRMLVETGVAGTGVRLPDGPLAGDEYELINRLADGVNMYPQGGARIDALADNFPIMVPPLGSAKFLCIDGTNWISR